MFWLPLLILGAGSPLTFATDVCASLAAQPSYALAKQCLMSFEFHPAIFDTTLDNLRKTLPLIVFQDVAQRPPPTPFYQEPVDLVKGLDEIAKKRDTYTTDFEWNEEVSQLLLTMNDAHLVYECGCFRRFKYTQPFFPVAVVEPNSASVACEHENVLKLPCTPGFQTKIVIGASPIEPQKGEYAQHLGRVVEEINGMPATEYLWKFAQTQVGKYKDPMTRFNHVLAQRELDNGKWTMKPGSFAFRIVLPKLPSVKYKLAASKELPELVLDIPWNVTISKNNQFTTKDEYWNKLCLADPTKKGKEASEVFAGVEDDVNTVKEDAIQAQVKQRVLLDDKERKQNSQFWKAAKTGVLDELRYWRSLSDPNQVVLKDYPDVLHTKRFVHLPSFIDAQLFQQITMQPPTLQSRGLAFFRLPTQPHIGVLKVMTFGGFSNLTMQNEWRQSLAKMLTHQQDGKCITKLILDMSSNGGGEPCLAQELTAVLIAKHRDPKAPFTSLPNNFAKDFRLSPFLSELMAAAMKQGSEANSTSFYPRNYRHPQTREIYQGLELLNPHKRQFHKLSADFTQPFTERCRSPADNPLRTLKLPLSVHKDIAIVSNGMCGSACGRVYFYLTEMFSVPTIVTGSLANVRRTASAFPATTVYDYVYFLQQLKLLAMDSKSLPTAFPFVTNFRFPVRECLSRRHADVPLEYVYEPASHVVDYNATNVLRPPVVWEQAARLLKWI